MNFFKILWSLCTGTSVFPRLTEVRLWRALLHLLMLVLLCCLISAAGSWIIHHKRVDAVAERFFQHTGNIVLTLDDITLEKDPNVSRSYKLSGDFRFDYYVSWADFQNFSSDKESAGLICGGPGLAFWAKDFQDPDSMKFRLICFTPELLYRSKVNPSGTMKEVVDLANKQEKNYTAGELREAVMELLPETDREEPRECAPVYITEHEVASQVNLVLAGAGIVYFLVETFFLLLLTIVLFSIAQLFRANTAPAKIPYRVLLVTTVYSAFPPLVVATLFRTFELQSVSFQTIFFIAFFLYQIFAFQAVSRHYGKEQV